LLVSTATMPGQFDDELTDDELTMLAAGVAMHFHFPGSACSDACLAIVEGASALTVRPGMMRE